MNSMSFSQKRIATWWYSFWHQTKAGRLLNHFSWLIYTLSIYLKKRQLKLSVFRTLCSAFHLCSKEAYKELNTKVNNSRLHVKKQHRCMWLWLLQTNCGLHHRVLPTKPSTQRGIGHTSTYWITTRENGWLSWQLRCSYNVELPQAHERKSKKSWKLFLFTLCFW